MSLRGWQIEMHIPERWQAYPCAEYFSEHWCECGHFCEASQTWVIVPLSEAYENCEEDFFEIGRSGCDGIDFGFRKTLRGLWAYYPIDRDFKFMAESVTELVSAWCSSQLSV